MSAEIKPALTPEEWKGGRVERDSLDAWRCDEGGWQLVANHCSCTINREDNYAAAALALHGQPFGFTWEDVDALRFSAQQVFAAWRTTGGGGYARRCLSAADRIAALLPPREP